MDEADRQQTAPVDTVEDMYPEWDAAAAVAYEAYRNEVGGTTWDGKPIPSWDAIKPRQRNGWRMAVAAVAE